MNRNNSSRSNAVVLALIGLAVPANASVQLRATMPDTTIRAALPPVNIDKLAILICADAKDSWHYYDARSKQPWIVKKLTSLTTKKWQRLNDIEMEFGLNHEGSKSQFPGVTKFIAREYEKQSEPRTTFKVKAVTVADYMRRMQKNGFGGYIRALSEVYPSLQATQTLKP